MQSPAGLAVRSLRDKVKVKNNSNSNSNSNSNGNFNRNGSSNTMSIYHLSVKVIGRSAGRSATGAAAYRCAEKIPDERTGLIHDFTRKQGVEHTELILPGTLAVDRAVFWNQVEFHHKRGDSVLSREVEVALPSELTADQRKELALEFARELSCRYHVAADVAIHAPSRDGDERNHHAHIMLSACLVEPDGRLGKKAAELDPIYCQKHRLVNMADRERERWAELTNIALERAGRAERVDHRSLAAQGIGRAPSSHMGPAVAEMVRDGRSSAVALRMTFEAAERLQRAQLAGELDRELSKVDRSILDTSGNLAAALRERDEVQQVHGEARAGVEAFRAQADQRRDVAERKQQALQAFLAFKAERALDEQRAQVRREANAQELARQRQVAEAQRSPERSRGRGGPER